MTTDNRHNLQEILPALRRRKSLVWKITIATIILGVIAYIVIPKKYKGETILVLKNPSYTDRGNLYSVDNRSIDYFASEEDIDRFIAMFESDVVQNKIIRDMHLARAYKFDSTTARGVYKIKRQLRKRLSIYRTEKKDIVLSYIDTDPERVAAVANYSATVLENSLRTFYNEMKLNALESIRDKIKEQDSTINILTDTLIRLRKRYGINDIISPSRHNIMLSALKDNGNPEFATGVETIQNIESIKDEMVSSRSLNITLAGQYTTGAKLSDVPLTKVLKTAIPPVKHEGLNLIGTIIVCSLAGFFFSIIYILVANFFQSRSPED